MNRHTVQLLKVGECNVRDRITFAGGGEGTRLFYLYVGVIRTPDGVVLVDTGPADLEAFNRGVEDYIPGGIRQTPEETTPRRLAACGVHPEEVRWVAVTHLHPDHCEFFDLFPNAALVVQKQGFTDALPSVRPRVMAALARRWPQSLRLVSAPEEILVPGIRCVHLGCHSPCSQAVVVDTERGRAVFAGDVAYLYANLESDRPIGGVPPPAWATAAATIRRYADILIPGHDPEVLERWPGGWIPACC